MHTRKGKNTNQIDWTYEILNEFIKRGKLDLKEKFIITTRVLKHLTYNEQEKLIDELLNNRVFFKHRSKREHLFEGLTIKEQADILNCSTKSIDRKIQRLKEKYDVVQLMYPQVFPRRNVYDNMNINYDNFKGYFRVDGLEGTEYIDFMDKHFNSFQEMRFYIINNVSEKYGKSFHEFDKLHITINMDLDLNINEKI